MGAWGHATFDNDAACDWCFGLAAVTDLSLIEQALAAVFADEYLESHVGAEALAAIETLARLQGSPGLQNSYSETVDAWVAANPQAVPGRLIEQSNRAIATLLLVDRSELAVLWAETDSYRDWLAEVDELQARLKPSNDEGAPDTP